MRKLLLVLFLLTLSTPSKAVVPRLVVFYENTSSNPGTLDEMECSIEMLKRQGWVADYYNASVRTWNPGGGISDGDWFAARYSACLVLNWDGSVSSANTTNGPYGNNFRDASGVSRVGESPLDGRWKIPCVVLAERLTTSATFNDTSSTDYVNGILNQTFIKLAEDSLGTWRYRVVGRFNNTVDTLYSDPRYFACKPNPWTGPGQVAALLWMDSTYTARCANDTVMVAWRYQPRGDRPGVVYCLLNSSYQFDICTSSLFALQYLAVNSQCKPNVPTKITLMEHNSYPTTITVGRVSNYKLLKDAQSQFGIKYIAAVPQVAPTVTDIGHYNNEVINKLKDHFNQGLAKWQPQSNSSGWTMNVFNGLVDTLEVRKAFNAMMNTAVSDTFKFPKDKMYIRSLVTASGEVSTNLGKVLKDAGVDIIETTFTTPDVNGQVYQAGNRSNQLTPYIVIADGRTIYVRQTWGFLENATFTGLIGSSNGYEYVGRTWIGTLSHAMTSNTSIYYHCNTVCGDDPYASWLFTRVLSSYFRFFNKIMLLDYSSPAISIPTNGSQLSIAP